MQKLDQSNDAELPKNLSPALQVAAWDPGREYSRAVAARLTGIAYNAKVTRAGQARSASC